MRRNKIEATFIISVCTVTFFYLIMLIISLVFTKYYTFLENQTIESINNDINVLQKESSYDDLKYFIVRLNNDNEIIDVSTSFLQEKLTPEKVKHFVNQVFDNEGNEIINNYRFKLYKINNTKVIIFLNCEDSIIALEMMLSLLIYIFIGISLFIIVMFSIFSSLFLKPFYKNFQQQKEFITNASHDLKTPLAIISANAEVLQMTMENNEWLDNIISETKNMNDLINNLLMLAKADEIDTKLPKTYFNLSKLVVDIIHSFEERFTNKNLTLNLNIDDNIEFNGNEFEIKQLINLLLDNATKYSSEGGNINISIHEKGSKIYLNFFNNTDVTDIDTKKIFNRFYSSKKSRDRTQGHGIGLSVAHTIVNRNNGSIKAETQKDGIIFRIILPIKLIKRKLMRNKSIS